MKEEEEFIKKYREKMFYIQGNDSGEGTVGRAQENPEVQVLGDSGAQQDAGGGEEARMRQGLSWGCL